MFDRSRARRKAILAALTASTVLLGWGARAETLTDALIAAYGSNPTLQAERARQRVTDEQVPRALANWRPTVTMTSNIGTTDEESRTQNARLGPTFTTREPATLSVTVAQPLYRGGRTTAETQQAENLILRGRALLLGVEQNVFLDVVTTYMNVVRDTAVLDLNLNNEQVLTRQLEATRARFQVGEITRTDVVQAEARLAGSTADRIQAEGNLTTSRSNYRRVVGQLPGKLDMAVLPQELPGNSGDAIAAALAGSPTVRAATYAEQAARYTIELVAGENLPTVNLNGSVARNHESGNPSVIQETKTLTAQITVPLYTAGGVDARVREAKQTAGQRRIEIDTARRQAQQDAASAFEALTTAQARLVSLSAQIKSAETALDGVEQEARVGSRTVLDVLNAEQELLNARVNYVRAERDEIVAGYQLTQAMGKLNARDLGLPIDLYDPAVNYNDVRGRFVGNRIPGE